jgi:N-acetylglucosaminyldiphosphoundecaprenol N-acetyl-beta-D-mannosaminyltransferase
MQLETTPRNKPGVLLGIPIGRDSLASTIAISLKAIENNGPKLVFACANTHSLVVAQSDPEFRSALENADLVVADGAGISLVGRLLGIDVGTRIAGEEYFWSLMRALNARGKGRVFFFGSSTAVLEKISKRFQTDFPDLQLCGTLSPPFRSWSDEENNAMLNAINAAKPDVLWVGMTAPKQEKWAYKYRAALNAPVIGSIGAVFDFYAGTTQSPPPWMRAWGVESLFHLIRNPKRTWRRVFVSIPKFILHVLIGRLTTNRNH